MPVDTAALEGDPVASVLVLSQRLCGRGRLQAEQAASRIDQIFASQPLRLLVALDHAFRDRRRHRELGIEFAQVGLSDIPLLSSLGTAALAVASMQRDGFVREAALAHLDGHQNGLAVACLVARVGDYVTEVAQEANFVIDKHMRADRADLFVQSLPIMRRIRLSKRGARAGILDRIHAMLCSDDPRCEAALWQGTKARDSELRREACRYLADRHAGSVQVQRVLDAALSDPDPATRMWAAVTARKRAITPEKVQAALVARMDRDPSPGVRLLALRARAHARDVEAVARAAFDQNANVRYFARKYLRSLGAQMDQRAHALQILVDPLSTTSEVVGALATLSELGRGDDLPVVGRFLADGRRRVAAEAVRTLGMLKT